MKISHNSPKFFYDNTKTQSQSNTYVDKISITNLFNNLTNLLTIPVTKNTDNDKLCHPNFHLLFNALHLNHFTNIGHSQVQNCFIARKSNQFPITHYDHTVFRYMKDSHCDTDPRNHNLPRNDPLKPITSLIRILLIKGLIMLLTMHYKTQKHANHTLALLTTPTNR